MISAILLIVGVPLYQALALEPAGFSSALNTNGANTLSNYLSWIQNHTGLFLGYRALLLLAFALIITLPFSLYRIIVAQEILGQQELKAQEEENEVADQEEGTEKSAEEATAETAVDGLPAFAWRGKGFVVLAAWIGTAGLILYLLGTIISTLYLMILSGNIAAADGASTLYGILTIATNTIGIGLLGLGMLFFGAMISRTGLNLWPPIWLTLGYAAILVGALLCIGAIAAATAAGGSQGLLNTAATFLFALWTLWFGVTLARLQAEA